MLKVSLQHWQRIHCNKQKQGRDYRLASVTEETVHAMHTKHEFKMIYPELQENRDKWAGLLTGPSTIQIFIWQQDLVSISALYQ